jgi:CubicO group peptidase (beta-lactamase class C family)
VSDLAADVDSLAAETRFSGVVRVDLAGETVVAKAWGLARRGDEVANRLDTRFGIASGTKGFTALVVASLCAEGVLGLATQARRFLGADLPLVGDDVTVEQLLAHRSGIGDYLDESVVDDANAYVLPLPVHELATTEDYVRVLEGHAAKFAPDERFEYCNSGYVVLAVVAERATSVAFSELVRERICVPVGMQGTEFLRSDELPANTAVGYLDVDGLRSNVLHLPVRGSGDGGIYSTAADVRAFWRALFTGAIVAPEWVDKLTRARSDTGRRLQYGLGFWLDPQARAVILEGSDAGVSFRSVHVPRADATFTVISNTSRGAWPLARLLANAAREIA